MGAFSQAEIESLLRWIGQEVLRPGERGKGVPRNIFTPEELDTFRLNGAAGSGRMRILGRGSNAFLRVTPG